MASCEAYGAIGSRLSQHMKQLAGEAVAREAEVNDLIVSEGKYPLVDIPSENTFRGRWRIDFSVTLQKAYARKIRLHASHCGVPLAFAM